MSFEEDFPSLKDKACLPLKWKMFKIISEASYVWQSIRVVPEKATEIFQVDVFNEKDISKCCLDKQKVKEKIDFFCELLESTEKKTWVVNTVEGKPVKEWFYKELGLDE